MRKIMCSMAMMLAAMQNGVAAEQVWRYIDGKSGQVTYSNVQVKGVKGNKMEVMAYPVMKSPRVSTKVVSTGSIASPIPPEMLRQLQGVQRLGAPPTGLPPLPALPGGLPGARLLMKEPISLGNQKEDAITDDSSGAPEPKWAKEVTVPAMGSSPAWAKDPFTSQK